MNIYLSKKKKKKKEKKKSIDIIRKTSGMRINRSNRWEVQIFSITSWRAKNKLNETECHDLQAWLV